MPPPVMLTTPYQKLSLSSGPESYQEWPDLFYQVLRWQVQPIVADMILSLIRHLPMPEIHDVLIAPIPNPDNSSLSPPVSFDVIVRNDRHNNQDIRPAQINLQPFFYLTLQCSFDTAGMYA